MLLTEEQVADLGYEVVQFLKYSKETKDLNVGEWVLVLSTAIFMLGQESKDESLC